MFIRDPSNLLKDLDELSVDVAEEEVDLFLDLRVLQREDIKLLRLLIHLISLAHITNHRYSDLRI